MVKRSRKKFTRRFNLSMTEAMHNDIHEIAASAQRNGVTEDVAEVVRRMIARETPFFMAYVSLRGRLPNGELDTSSTEGA